MNFNINELRAVTKSVFDKTPYSMVLHQITSFNDYAQILLPLLIQQYNPITVYHDYDETMNKYATEIKVYLNFNSINEPIIHEINGSTKPMYPHDARLRNLTYSSVIYVDMKVEVYLYSGENFTTVEKQEKSIYKINFGKIPIMLHSVLCLLSKKNNKLPRELGECKLDMGGYFIINGSEKVIITQERQADNNPFCFKNTKTKYSHVVEIKSTSANKLLPAKTLNVKITSKDGLTGKTIYVSCSQFRQDIPLFVLFRALGIETDRDIVEKIVYNSENPDNHLLLYLLQPSLEEASNIMTQPKAFEYLSKHINIMGHPKELKLDTDKKIAYVRDALSNDLLPHVGTSLFMKSLFLGYMTRKLLFYYLGYVDEDDRDSYTKKRLDTPGVLLANLTRQYLTKMIKDLRNSLMKEMNTGNWKYSKKIDDLINQTNIYKIIKSTTLDSGMKYSLATGTWGMKGLTTASKVGVAQVLNRLSTNSTLSHMRRINTPIEKSSKLVQPRKLHSTSWGYICPSETPEGGPVGVVKNMAMGAEITTFLDATLLEPYIFATGVIEINESIDMSLFETHFIVFLNGAMKGFTSTPMEVCKQLKGFRRKGIIHPYVSITFNIAQKEIRVQTDAGRITRPLFIVNAKGHIDITAKHKELIAQQKLEFKHLLTGFTDENGVYYDGILEYVDAQEAETSLVATKQEEFHTKKYTHCEIDNSLILGLLAGIIPFSDHNQSPRNTYQSAMGKQAMGVYCTNFLDRMDTLANILSYPSRALVNTSISNHVKQDIPSGSMVIVAILAHSGFNQEDSVIMCGDAIKRGLFHSTFSRTFKDEEKKNQASGQEEKFMAPIMELTKGMKPGSYGNLDKDGFAKINSYLRGGDVLIGKVIPIKEDEKAMGIQKNKPYRDQSTTMRHNENGMVDKVFFSRNTDGYKLVKSKVRMSRYPTIGDKFSSRHGQKGTVGMIYSQQDMPFTRDGLVPDIIINPHAIPSRMTIAQLVECIMGKACCHLGISEGDGSPFTGLKVSDLCKILSNQCGMERNGNEILYNGRTGEQLPCEVFMGPTFYQRLRHMVDDKIHPRSTGPLVMLTRQPAEGRSRDGGLRWGEMERDCVIAHGGAEFLKERMMDMSDNYKTYVSKKSGLIVAVNKEKGIYNMFDKVLQRKGVEYSEVRIPYAFKLMLQEVQTMGIAPRLITTESKENAETVRSYRENRRKNI